MRVLVNRHLCKPHGGGGTRVMCDRVVNYRQGVLNELLEHGVRPRPVTPPRLVRAFLNDLYRYELRQLRERLLRGEIAKGDYAGRSSSCGRDTRCCHCR